MNGKLYINGYDAWDTWGVFLEEGSYEKLLSGDTMKPYTTNQSRSIDGVVMQIKNPRMEERYVTIVFCFAQTVVSFLTRYEAFIGTLKSSLSPITLKVPELNKTYRLVYDGNINLSQSGLRIGKIAVRFIEPNPANRAIL